MRLVNLLLINAFFLVVFPALAHRVLGPDPGAKSAPGGDFGSPNRGVTEVRFGKINSGRINYEDIKGSPFWNQEWKKAIVYVDNVQIGTLKVRLNLATQELHFLKDDQELVGPDINITRLVFIDQGDTVSFISNIPNLLINRKKVEGFIQEMNLGDYQLLKHTVKTVNSADSLLNTRKRFYFEDEVFYFLKNDQTIERIKKLNKENILAYLPGAFSYNKWIADANIDFEKEEDVIRFLRFYNSQRTKIPSRQ